MLQEKNRKLVLEDGSQYEGFGFGAAETSVTEVVFNTSMVGYQEILSDPSYTNQTVVMTYPLIGNYGISNDDFESSRPTIGGLIVREYNDHPSYFRSVTTLDKLMKEHHIPGLWGIDTRKLVRSIRDCGSRRGVLTDIGISLDECFSLIEQTAIPHDSVARVSPKERKDYPVPNAKYRVAAIDCGMKRSIVRCLNERGCSVAVLPWNTSVQEVLSCQPDGLFLSNGPGDPTDVQPLIRLVRMLRGRLPIFGICLGHQVLSLAYGASTYKLKFGHRGGNHPVRNLLTGTIEITSQNHSYAVDEKSLAGTDLTVTHLNLLDHTVEGVQCHKDRAFSVQYHPESAPGPQDSAALFDQFIALMEENRHA